MMESDDRKLNGNFVWLFAAAAFGAALVAPKLIHGVTSVKAMAGVFGMVFAAFGVASTILARTGGLRAAAAFALAGLGHGIYWYVSVHSATSSDGAAMSAIGSSVGMVLTASFGAASIVGGVGGALFGLKVRRNLKKTVHALAQRSR